MSDALNRIPISAANRWRNFRYHFLPTVTFFVLLGVLGWMWKYHVGPSHVLGEVETVRVRISSPADGLIQHFSDGNKRYWNVFDQVYIDDVVVTIEPVAVVGQAVLPSDVETTDVETYSPFNGTIVEIDRWPGQNVWRGDPILTIATNESHFVLSHIPESHRKIPLHGDEVSMRVQGSPTTIGGVIAYVGPIVAKIPTRQLPIPDGTAYGLPIRIKLSANHNLRPGALVEIRF